MRRTSIFAAAVIVVLGGVIAVAAVRSGASPEQAAALPVTAEDGRIYGLGTVEARILSKLGFEVTGTLAGLAADQGDQVTRGQMLASLDAREQRARLAQAEASLRQSDAALTQARARLDRARALQVQRRSVNERRQSLARRGTVSVEAAEDAEAASVVATADLAVAASDVEAALGAVEAARAKVQLEQAILDKYTLAAPYDGLVVERTRELGAAITAGAPVFTLIDPATVWVSAYVDEALAGGLAVGQRVDIALRSQPGRTFPGRIDRIDIENDRVSEERRVNVIFDSRPVPFHLGEQAEILVDAARP